jgi:uncharacterized membrane protein
MRHHRPTENRSFPSQRDSHDNDLRYPSACHSARRRLRQCARRDRLRSLRVGYFTGISALIGVVIAHVKVDDADPVLRSHYQFQIRTFWIGFLYIAVGCVLTMVLIGIPIMMWWFVWSLIRITKGFITINEHRPIANPMSWLFG